MSSYTSACSRARFSLLNHWKQNRSQFHRATHKRLAHKCKLRTSVTRIVATTESNLSKDIPSRSHTVRLGRGGIGASYAFGIRNTHTARTGLSKTTPQNGHAQTLGRTPCTRIPKHVPASNSPRRTESRFNSREVTRHPSKIKKYH